MRFAIAITAKRFAHRCLLVNQGNPGTASPSFSLCCCWKRDFSGESYDYREKIRGGFLQDIKLDDAIGLFSEMVKSRPLPSIVDFCKLLTAIAKMNKYDVAITLGEQMQKLGIAHNLYFHKLFLLLLSTPSRFSSSWEDDETQDMSPALSLLPRFASQWFLMVDLGYEPNTVTFTTLIHGLFLHNQSTFHSFPKALTCALQRCNNFISKTYHEIYKKCERASPIFPIYNIIWLICDKCFLTTKHEINVSTSIYLYPNNLLYPV